MNRFLKNKQKILIKTPTVVPQRLDFWRFLWYNVKNNIIMANYTCFLWDNKVSYFVANEH